MGKPAKIRKKKSFMFTTKHHSFLGWLSGVIGIGAIATFVTLVIDSYNNAGGVEVKFGAVGLFLALLNIIGLISGMISVREKDVYVYVPIGGIVLNGAMILAWVLIIVLGH